MALELVPLTRDAANELIQRWHRHRGRVQGHRFPIGLKNDGEWCGVAIVGNPPARALCDGQTAEVTRLATDGSANACSKLYAACWRAWRAMGGTRLVTYTLQTEPGTSLIASGFKFVHVTKEHRKGWDTPAQPRVAEPQGPKTLWELVA